MMVLYSVILMTLTPKVDYKTALDFYVFNSSVTVFNVVLGKASCNIKQKDNDTTIMALYYLKCQQAHNIPASINFNF